MKKDRYPLIIIPHPDSHVFMSFKIVLANIAYPDYFLPKLLLLPECVNELNKGGSADRRTSFKREVIQIGGNMCKMGLYHLIEKI